MVCSVVCVGLILLLFCLVALFYVFRLRVLLSVYCAFFFVFVLCVVSYCAVVRLGVCVRCLCVCLAF